MEYVQIIKDNPEASIIFISIIVNLFILTITKYLTDQKRMKELKEKQKEFQKELKSVKGDVKKSMEIQSQMMQHSLELMKHSFKPLFITLIPLLVLFWWLRDIFSPVLPHWIWYYIISSIIASIILRKAMNVV